MVCVARDDTPENRSELFEALLRTQLFAAMPDGPDEGETKVAGEDEELSLLLLDSPDERVLPLFTSVDRMLEWKPEGSGYVASIGRDAFEMAATNDIARIEVNPGSATHGSIERHEIEALARGRLPIAGAEVVPEGRTLKIGTPAAKPADAVMDAVRESLSREDGAVAAWLFLVQEEPNPPEHTIAVAFTPEADSNEALRRVAQRAGDRSSGARELVYVSFEGRFRDLAARGIGELVFERARD